MDDADRFRLLHGPYKTPPFQYGDLVICERRGEVQLVGLSGGPIPWPVGKHGSVITLAVFGDLASAVRCEAAQAVAHWIGITPQTVICLEEGAGRGPEQRRHLAAALPVRHRAPWHRRRLAESRIRPNGTTTGGRSATTRP